MAFSHNVFLLEPPLVKNEQLTATDDIEEKQKWEEYSKTKFGIGKLGYKSDYGISFDWQKNNNKISISSSGNLEKNISEKIFYSEVIASSNLIMTN